MKKINQKKKIPNYENIIKRRFVFLLLLVIGLFSFLLVQTSRIMLDEQLLHSNDLSLLTYTEVLGNSSPRGRIYDRNYNIIVDNKSLKTIVYKKDKRITNLEMINLAKEIAPHIDLDYHKISLRNKREYFYAKNPEYCNSLVTEKEIDKVKQRKMTARELEELKISRIEEEKVNFDEEELKVAYIFYLMNKGYTYEEKVIKSDATDKEFAYISENNEKLTGFNTRIDWERVYPYGDTFKSMLGTVSTEAQGIPLEEKEEYLKKGYSLNDRVGLSYIEKQYEDYLHGEKSTYEVVNSHEVKLIKEGSRGKDIVLTIDINLQQEIDRILEEQIRIAKTEPNTEFYDSSSVVVQDPQTGEILAMSSKKIVNGEIIDNISSILMNPITPGSIVKGASMLVGYNEGAVHIGENTVEFTFVKLPPFLITLLQLYTFTDDIITERIFVIKKLTDQFKLVPTLFFPFLICFTGPSSVWLCFLWYGNIYPMSLCHVDKRTQRNFMTRSLLTIVKLCVTIPYIVLFVQSTDFVIPLPSYFSKNRTYEGKPKILIISVSNVTRSIIDALT